MLLHVLCCCSPAHWQGWHVRAEETPQRVLEILSFLLEGERSKQAEEGESAFKTYTEKCKSLPTNARLRERSLTSAVLWQHLCLPWPREGSFLPWVWVWNCNRHFHKVLSAQMSQCWLSAPFSAAENSRWEGQKQRRSLFNSQFEKSPSPFSQVAFLPPILSMAFSTSCFENYIYFTIYQTSS